jgi:hypothetical protein
MVLRKNKSRVERRSHAKKWVWGTWEYRLIRLSEGQSAVTGEAEERDRDGSQRFCAKLRSLYFILLARDFKQRNDIISFEIMARQISLRNNL